MPLSPEEYLKQNPELATLVEEIALDDPVKLEAMIRWHGLRSPVHGIRQVLDVLVHRARDKGERVGPDEIVRLPPEELIADSIARYPTLFLSRYQILDHILLTIGGGYEWSRGEVICYRDANAEPRRIPIEAAQILANYKAPVKHHYPWCEMCIMATMPGNIKPEWAAIVEEYRKVLVADGYSFVEQNIEPSKSKKLSVEEVAFDEFEELGDDPNE